MKGLLTLVSILALTQVAAASGEHDHASPYAGQQNRQIKSLSPEDIAELRRGGGWGLARAAELNGVPGPAHLLELKYQIPLEESQVAAITDLWRDMNNKAMAEGEKLIALERELEQAFRSGQIDDPTLQRQLRAISDSRMRLRYIHLSTHLKTPEILSAAQIGRYNELRGYAVGDPCRSVPEGHDPTMWRRHNGCD